MRTVGFIGLGKLGLPVALAIESMGFRVVGCEHNPRVKEYIAQRKVPFAEEGLQPLLDNTRIHLESVESVVEESDLVFCAVQTPHDPKFEGDRPLPEARADFDYSYLETAVKEVVEAATKLDKHTTLAVISTCLPGTYEERIKPLLTLASKVNYIYNPFFIAMGTVVRDFLCPEFVLLGVDDGDANPLQQFYTRIHGSDRTFVTDITTAEGIKVFYNTFITAKIVLGNMFGEFAHKTGMNVDDIYVALTRATDRLISPRYLKAGVGDGGGCHPRDNIALSYLARKVGMSFDLFDALMTARERHMAWLASIFSREIELTELPGVILGKSFKPESNLQTGSPAMLLAHILREWGWPDFQHYEFDFPSELPVAVYFIATQHRRYATLPYPAESVVIDPFRYVDSREGVKVISIGSGKHGRKHE